jgi:hypothetical protein
MSHRGRVTLIRKGTNAGRSGQGRLKAYDRAPRGCLSEVKVDLLLDRLHDDERFDALIKQMNLAE